MQATKRHTNKKVQSGTAVLNISNVYKDSTNGHLANFEASRISANSRSIEALTVGYQTELNSAKSILDAKMENIRYNIDNPQTSN